MPGCAKVMNLIGEVKDKNCVIIDDIVDTAGSFRKVLKHLLNMVQNPFMLVVLMVS